MYEVNYNSEQLFLLSYSIRRTVMLLSTLLAIANFLVFYSSLIVSWLICALLSFTRYAA